MQIRLGAWDESFNLTEVPPVDDLGLSPIPIMGIHLECQNAAASTTTIRIEECDHGKKRLHMSTT